jgi:hypothetical protein
MKRTISALTVAAVFAVFATTFAQVPAPESSPAPTPDQGMMTPPPVQSPAQAPGMGEEKKADKPMKTGKGRGKAKGHAKKANKKHGLDRANEAAGQHGMQGRDKARTNQ